MDAAKRRKLVGFSALFLLLLLVDGTRASTDVAALTPECTKEGEVCSRNNAHVCKNNTCVSVCSLRGMKECVCDTEEDNYCYLCCGNSHNKCRPAHEHGLLRINGERWERESCARCRMNGAEMEGLACDDRDPQRLCLQGKCSKSVCHDKHQGAYCDRKLEKICVEDVCENPCARIAPHLMVCDCPTIDPDTGFASEDRCQLCCFDFNVKPSSRRCQSAFRKYQIATPHNRPIWRVGLDCAGGKTCNRYGICSSDAGLGFGGAGGGFWQTSVGRVAMALFLLLCVPLLI
ncbi:hypothetical protein M3Y99_00418800 [Aphelenchoides fujianensis]|nr:hypothetical protein M3Y99_00418800 [Aphelenchoides fujianensis]